MGLLITKAALLGAGLLLAVHQTGHHDRLDRVEKGLDDLRTEQQLNDIEKEIASGYKGKRTARPFRDRYGECFIDRRAQSREEAYRDFYNCLGWHPKR